MSTAYGLTESSTSSTVLHSTVAILYILGWWVDRPEDIAKVPGSHQRPEHEQEDGEVVRVEHVKGGGGGSSGGGGGGSTSGAGDAGDGDDADAGDGGGGSMHRDDGSDGDGLMWAILTRKCHWLGPCVAVKSAGPADRDGATTEWIVRGMAPTLIDHLYHNIPYQLVFRPIGAYQDPVLDHPRQPQH
jgi:hypothetical protein